MSPDAKSFTELLFSDNLGKQLISMISAALTHSQRDTASGQDFSVGLRDALAGVFQIIHVNVYIPDVSNHQGLERRCPGATVVSP